MFGELQLPLDQLEYVHTAGVLQQGNGTENSAFIGKAGILNIFRDNGLWNFCSDERPRSRTDESESICFSGYTHYGCGRIVGGNTHGRNSRDLVQLCNPFTDMPSHLCMGNHWHEELSIQVYLRKNGIRIGSSPHIQQLCSACNRDFTVQLVGEHMVQQIGNEKQRFRPCIVLWKRLTNSQQLVHTVHGQILNSRGSE